MKGLKIFKRLKLIACRTTENDINKKLYKQFDKMFILLN